MYYCNYYYCLAACERARPYNINTTNCFFTWDFSVKFSPPVNLPVTISGEPLYENYILAYCNCNTGERQFTAVD